LDLVGKLPLLLSRGAPAGKGVTSMMAVIFEVWPAKGRKDDYLKLAASLRAEVEQIDGFISVERFESLYEEGKLLSLQFWRDEASITAWRNHLRHRQAQAVGRGGMFADYRLRIAEVVRDYGPEDRAQAPASPEAAFPG
jgi:heme-degrading monooxygenase HmoA